MTVQKELKLKTKASDKNREFAVILERVHTDIKIIIEDLSTVKQKVEAIFEEQGRQKEEVFIIKMDIRTIKTDIGEIKELLKNHEKRLSHLETVK
jgi:N-glycosylase/DNA lyase